MSLITSKWGFHITKKSITTTDTEMTTYKFKAYSKILEKLYVCIYQQARSQSEPRKHGLQHHMRMDTRNPDFDCEHQRGRPASLGSLISAFTMHYMYLKSKVVKFVIELVNMPYTNVVCD